MFKINRLKIFILTFTFLLLSIIIMQTYGLAAEHFYDFHLYANGTEVKTSGGYGTLTVGDRIIATARHDDPGQAGAGCAIFIDGKAVHRSDYQNNSTIISTGNKDGRTNVEYPIPSEYVGKTLWVKFFCGDKYSIFGYYAIKDKTNPVNVSLSNAKFSADPMEPGKSYTASVYSSNSGKVNYEVWYTISYYKNGDWSVLTGGSTKNNGYSSTLTTPSFTVPQGATSMKVEWQIIPNPYINITNGTATATAKVTSSNTKPVLKKLILTDIINDVGSNQITIKGFNTRWGYVGTVTAEYSDGTTERISDPAKLQYRSSDENIVKIDSKGMITSGTKSGSATITITYNKDGNSISAELYVKVEASSTSEKPIVMFVGEPLFKVTPVGSPDNPYGHWAMETKIKSTKDTKFNFNYKIDFYLTDGSYKSSGFQHTYTNSENECEKIKNSDGTYTYVFNPNGSPLPENLKTAKLICTILSDDNITISGTNPITVTVNVSSPTSKQLRSITVSPSTKEIIGFNTAGGNLKVTATYSDNSTKDVTALAKYTSSNTNIVTVNSSGALTSGNTAGTAEINVSYTEGEVTANAKCIVTVTQATDTTPPTLQVTPNGGKITSNTKITITASDPSGINHIGYVWDNGDRTTPVYSNTAVIEPPKSSGTHTLKVYAKDNSPQYNRTEWISFTYSVEDSRPTVTLSGAGFNPDKPTIDSRAKAYVDIIISNPTKFTIEYKIMYSKDGSNYYTLRSSSLYGYRSEKLETGDFYIQKDYKALKAVFTIPENEPVNVNGNRTIETTVNIVRPTVTLSGAGFNPDKPTIGSRAKAYVDTTNSGTTKFKIEYKIMYSKDGSNYNTLRSSSLYQSGRSSERLETGDFYIKDYYKALKAVFTIPESEPVNVNGNRTIEIVVNLETPSNYVFSDVPQNHWAYTAITELAKRGIISGFPDGTFKPDKEVTRAEFAKIMALALQLPIVQPNTPTFIDVNKDNWAYPYVESAKNYLTGYKTSNGLKFKPNESSVREDIAVALVKAKGYQNENVDVSELTSIFTDSNEISPNLKKYVLIAYKKNLIKGYPDKTFRPKANLTRAETAYLLWQIISSEEDGEKVTF